MKKLLLIVLIMGVLLPGCAPEKKPTDGSTPSITVSQGPSEVPSASPEPKPTPAVPITLELANEILERGRVTHEKGMDAPGAMGEFYAAHPDFLRDQSRRVWASPGQSLGQQVGLLFPQGQPLEDDFINRERLGEFVKNYQSGTPDRIVILSSGEPLALLLTVFTYDGQGTAYTVASCYPLGERLQWEPEYTSTQIDETDRVWVLSSNPEWPLWYPKYGYEPIPLGEVQGERTEGEVQQRVEQLCLEQSPQTDSVVPQEPQTVHDVPCYVFQLHQLVEGKSVYTGDTLAVAKDLSRFYQIEQVNGQWVLQARAKG